MKKRYLELYHEWMETGDLPSDGLCPSMGNGLFFELFEPNKEESPEYYHKSPTGGYWAYDGTPCSAKSHLLEPLAKTKGVSKNNIMHDFTPLRQTIVLLMHEISQDTES